VRREFAAAGRGRLWLTDITYIPSWAGFLYPAVVLDASSDRVVGRSTANHLRTDLLLAALNKARMAIFEFIEGWYNPHPRQSGIDMLSLMNSERRALRHQRGGEAVHGAF